MNIRGMIQKSLEESGILISVDGMEDINLAEYEMDSLTFVNFIVTLEEELGIAIPDQYLNVDVLQSLEGFTVLLEQLVADETNSSPNECLTNLEKGGERI